MECGARLRLLNEACIAPFGLDIDFADLPQLPVATPENYVHYTCILDELRLWGRLLAHRPLSQLHVRCPFQVLDPSELTELVHVIAQNFRVLVADHVEHAVTLREQDLTKLNLGLLRGLHFNHFFLEVGSGCTLDSARLAIMKLNQFRARYVSLAFRLPCCPVWLRSELPAWLQVLTPETVVFQGDVSGEFHAFPMNPRSGPAYRFSPPDRLFRSPSSLGSPPGDRVCVGPGRRSQLGTLAFRSHSDVPEYCAALRRGHLPVLIVDTN